MTHPDTYKDKSTVNPILDSAQDGFLPVAVVVPHEKPAANSGSFAAKPPSGGPEPKSCFSSIPSCRNSKTGKEAGSRAKIEEGERILHVQEGQGQGLHAPSTVDDINPALPIIRNLPSLGPLR